MKRTMAVFGFALLASGGAYAADLNGGLKDAPAPIVIPGWTGFYFGANGGYGQSSNVSDPVLSGSATYQNYTAAGHVPVAGSDDSGFLFGGQIGYLYQPSSTGLVFGAEFSFDGSNISGDKAAIATGEGSITDPSGKVIGKGTAIINTASHQQLDYIGTLTGVVGVTFGNALPYIKGGLAFGQVQESVGVGVPGGLILSHTGTDTGWTAGGGLAYKVAQNWSLFAEYDYYNLGSHSLALTESVNFRSTTVPVKFSTSSINEEWWATKIGVNYQVGSVYTPLK